MSNEKIQKMVDETVFTMEVEGFILTDEEKNTLFDVLDGKISFHDKLHEYIKNAKRRGAGETVNVNLL